MGNLESKNTVKATNQVSRYVYEFGDMTGTPKILFLGNSITKHEPKPEIGWYGNWGMAASSAEKDYVHLCMNTMLKKYPNAAFCMVQGAVWERSYRDCDFDEYFKEAKDFNPDVIICLISENIVNEDFDADVFIEQFHNLHMYLSGNNKNAKIIVTSNFFNNEAKNEAIKAYAEKYKAIFIYISDIINDKENLAGEYEHEGIRIHPSDNGMAIIARRIIERVL